jgi:hypothetical protein
MSNHKAISLLTSFAKIFEKIMQTRLKSHSIFGSEQYGYRKNWITNNATYTMTNKILTAMNNKSKAGGIFCDLVRAFDCVNHIL